MGRYFAESVLGPPLCIGVMYWVLRAGGTLPLASDLVQIRVKGLQIFFLQFLYTLAGMSSSIVPALMFSSSIALMMSLSSNFMLERMNLGSLGLFLLSRATRAARNL